MLKEGQMMEIWFVLPRLMAYSDCEGGCSIARNRQRA